MAKYKSGDVVIINNKCVKPEWVGLVGTITSIDQLWKIYEITFDSVPNYDYRFLRLREEKLDLVSSLTDNEDDSAGLDLL
jgi:hypothetical protein